MAQLPLYGIVTALATPFRPDERIDYGAWQAIIDRQIASGVDGLLAVGALGECFALGGEERRVALRFCRQHVAGRVTLYGNVGSATTRGAIEMALHAEAEGVDVLAAVTPYGTQPTEEELVEHYVELCRAVRSPVVACNLPRRTGVDLTPSAAARIASRAENFAGLHDFSGELERIPQYLAAGAGRPFSVFLGGDHAILRGLEMGCAGAVSPWANVAPRLFVDLYRAFCDGWMEEASRLQALAVPLHEALALHTFPAVVKAAMGLAGTPAGKCRKPVGPMPPAALERLAAVMNELGREGYLTAPAAALRA